MPALAPVPVAAATPGLTITSTAVYDVLPEEHRVGVTAELIATNHLKDTITRRYYFRTAFLTVQPGTSDFKLTGGSGRPKVTVHETTDTYTTLKLDFGANLAAGKVMHLTLGFNIRDAGGAAGRPVRISPSLVTFSAWAFATSATPGSSVLVSFPPGYSVTIGRGPLTGPVTDVMGRDQWSSGPIDAPLDFIADFVADRPVEFAESSLTVPLTAGDATVLVRAWPDDPAWGERVSNIAQHAIPILEREIGVPWPVDGPLAVSEALVRTTGGYAGVFDPAERHIEIAYAASDNVVIHELAHAWFSGRLVADRWIAEAFASYYAEIAVRELGLDIRPPTPPIEPNDGAIPLNAWRSSSNPVIDTYAYAASLDLARAIAGRAGPEALRAVWGLAARGIGAYRPDLATEEPVAGPPDWRGLLDLLEEQADADFEDLWRQWVARPEDLPALDARGDARTAYSETVEKAGDWRLPISIRNAMRTWRFDIAGEELSAADDVLDQRTSLETVATAARIDLPPSLRDAFEGTGGLTAAAAEAATEIAALEMIAAAMDAEADDLRPDPANGLLVRLGLLGRDPGIELDAARQAFSSGDVASAYASARSARDAWSNAADVGRSRIVSAILLVVALLLFVGLVRGAQRRKPTEAS